MAQRILVSAFFDNADPLRLPYFEKLDELLGPCGFSLSLLNQSSKPAQTDLENVNLPPDLFAANYRGGNLSEDLLAASVVQAATRRSDDIDRASGGILRYVRFLRKQLWQRRPWLCVFWNQFTGLHMAAVSVCRELGIPWVFAHEGLLPGSIIFEEDGQMGESWITQDPEKFMALPVDAEDLDRALQYLQYARKKGLNRKRQTSPGSVAKAIAPARRLGRKIVFYAGQNDYQSGMYPPWLPNARLHSPHYTHTNDALHDLARQAERFDWQILFKPHPNLTSRGQDYSVYSGPFADRVTVAQDSNIFECIELSDVTTTIVSQVSYLALMRERPVVLLGRNQLSGKQCVWEPGNRAEVGAAIEQALASGFDDSRGESWLRHVAQLLQHNLFCYDKQLEQYFRQNEIDAARYMMMQSHLPLAMHAKLKRSRASVVPRPLFLLGLKMRSAMVKPVRRVAPGFVDLVKSRLQRG